MTVRFRSGLRVQTLEGVTELDRGQWDELARQACFYLSWDWMQAWERQANVRPHVLAVFDEDERLRGALPCYRTRSGTGNPLYDLSHLLAGWPTRAISDLDPQLFAGGNSGYRGNVLYDRDAEPELKAAVLSALGTGLRRTATELGARSWGCLYLDRTVAAEFAAHCGDDVVPVVIGVSATMSVRYEDFDGYLASLSASSRSNARRDIRLFHSTGTQVLVERGLRPWIDRFAPLLANVQANHGADPSVAGAAGYLRLCAAGRLDERAVVFLAHHRDELVSFALAYEFGDSLWMRVVGLDYARAADCGAYFTTYFYEPIRYALARGLREIDFGIESFEGKLRKGARLEPQWALIWPFGQSARHQSDTNEWNVRQYERWHTAYGHHTGFPPVRSWTLPMP